MATRFIEHLLTGDHASRPGAGTVPEGTLYACSDHDLIYQSDGVSAWSTWSDVGSGGGITSLTGDVTGTGPGATATTIANDVVTFAKMQNVPTDSLAGRDTAATGDLESILLNATLSMDGAGNLQRAALTGDVTASAGSNATTIANGAVTNAKAADMAESTIKGRAAGAGTGNQTDLTATQATAVLNNLVGDSGSGGTKGLAPAPGAGDAAAGKFLKADATWAVPTGGGGSHDHTTGDGSGVLTNDEHDGYMELTEIVAPSTPAANKLRLYAKDNTGTSALYFKDDAGTETQVGSGGGGAPTTAKYVTTASDGTLSAEVVIPGFGGSPDRAAIAGGGTSREFESGDTAPTWSPSSPASTDVGTTFPSHLYASATDTTERLGLYSWAPGSGAFDARMKIAVGSGNASNASTAGLIITDSGDSNRTLLLLSGQNAATSPRIQAFSYASSTYTQRGSNMENRNSIEYLRITRDGSNNISWWYSDDGLLWSIITTLAFTFTVANIGVRFALSAQPGNMAVDWLRTDV